MVRKFWVLVILFLGSVASAYAGPVNFAFLGFSGGNWENGYPYYVTAGPAGSVLAVMCDDYVHGGSVGDTWQANITDLGSNNLSLTRFGNTENVLGAINYKMAGWIIWQTLDTPTTQWTDMNEAVWHIFDPNAPIDAGGLTWLASAQMAGRGGFAGVNYNDIYVITPVNQYDSDPNSIQEFLYIGDSSPGGTSAPDSTTPEPGTLVLLGTGLLALLGRKFMN